MEFCLGFCERINDRVHELICILNQMILSV